MESIYSSSTHPNHDMPWGSEEYFDESEHVDGFAEEERSTDGEDGSGEEVDENEGEGGSGPEGSDFAAEEGYD